MRDDRDMRDDREQMHAGPRRFERAPRPGRRGGRGRSFGEGRTSEEDRAEIVAWFAGRLPSEWFEGPPTIAIDGDEILVVGALEAVELGEATPETAVAAGEEARISRFREESRPGRIQAADEAQARFSRVVSWGATAGGTTLHFTSANVPVMTRLRIGQRQVLDTLVHSGVARSRSEALAWCVELVGRNEAEWIGELRSAIAAVDAARASGPASTSAHHEVDTA